MDDEQTVPMPTPIFDLEQTVRVASLAAQRPRRTDKATIRSAFLHADRPARPSSEITPTTRTSRLPDLRWAVALGVMALSLSWVGVAMMRRPLDVPRPAEAVSVGAPVAIAPCEEEVAPTPSLAATESTTAVETASTPPPPRRVRTTRTHRVAADRVISMPRRSNEVTTRAAPVSEESGAPAIDAPSDSVTPLAAPTEPTVEEAPATPPTLILTPDF